MRWFWWSFDFYDHLGPEFEISLPGIGGGGIQAGSQADLEWANFLVQANASGFSLTRTPALAVTGVYLEQPDGGTSLRGFPHNGGAVARKVFHPHIPAGMEQRRDL